MCTSRPAWRRRTCRPGSSAATATSRSCACCRSRACRRPGTCAARMCLIAVHPGRLPGRAIPARGHRQPGQGRIGPSAPEHERDAGAARDHRARAGAPVPLSAMVVGFGHRGRDADARGPGRPHPVPALGAPLGAAGAAFTLKFETFQHSSSFQDRGALVKLASLSDKERGARRDRHVHPGNHAQGVAYMPRGSASPATIVMPELTPFVKVEKTTQFGARVLLEGELGQRGRRLRPSPRRRTQPHLHPPLRRPADHRRAGDDRPRDADRCARSRCTWCRSVAAG